MPAGRDNASEEFCCQGEQTNGVMAPGGVGRGQERLFCVLLLRWEKSGHVCVLME